MTEDDGEDMRLSLLGLIALLIAGALFLGAVASMHNDGGPDPEPVEVHYSISAICTLEDGRPYRLVTVQLLDQPPELSEVHFRIYNPTGYSMYFPDWSGLRGTFKTYTTGGLVGGPLPVDDLLPMAPGVVFILNE